MFEKDMSSTINIKGTLVNPPEIDWSEKEYKVVKFREKINIIKNGIETTRFLRFPKLSASNWKSRFEILVGKLLNFFF